MNQAQLEIAQGVLVRGGRIAVVGDDRQAIYGFRGADSNSLDRLKQELRATELGLTTTYRCGRRIVAEAAKIVPDIVAREGAHEGVVREATLDDAMRAVTPGDYILSRVNAPLVRIALTLIRQSKRAKIEGRDIGKGLRSIAVKLAHGKAATSLAQWHRNLDLWELKEADRAERADLPGKVDVVHDQADTLRALADSVNSVREIEARIETLFSDVGRDGGARAFIVCSSVHRAKGLEADRVWVLRDTLYPPVNCQCGHRHGWGKADCGKCKCRTYRPASSAQREEANIAYCAITRAKDELVWVSGK
jgi:superfamily I DNA/RNA helicase